MFDARNYGLSVAREYASYYLVKCPFHDDENPSAVFFKKNGDFECYGCRTKKKIGDFDADFVGVASPYLVDLTEDTEFEPVITQCADESVIAFMYCYNRKITSKSIRDYNIRWDPTKKNLVFEQHDFHGLVGHIRRRVDNGHPRYFVSGQKCDIWPHENFLNIINNDEVIFISEGPFKAIRLNQAINDGIKSFSIFGSVLRRSTIELLSQFKGQIVLIADNDLAGRQLSEQFNSVFKRARIFKPKIPFDDATELQCQKMYESILRKLENESFI